MGVYKTFDEWRAAGRSVREGEHATYYLVNDASGKKWPAFQEDQTEPWELVRTDGSHWRLVLKDELDARPAARTVKLGFDPSKERSMSAWIGNDPKMRDAIRQKRTNPKPRFNKRSNRWEWPASTTEALRVVEALRTDARYKVALDPSLAELDAANSAPQTELPTEARQDVPRLDVVLRGRRLRREVIAERLGVPDDDALQAELDSAVAAGLIEGRAGRNDPATYYTAAREARAA